METFCALKQKEVINVCDGLRLGFVCDIEFDIRSGRICKIIVPESARCWNFFGHDREYRIPWECIRRIGDDIILVDVDIDTIIFEC